MGLLDVVIGSFQGKTDEREIKIETEIIKVTLEIQDLPFIIGSVQHDVSLSSIQWLSIYQELSSLQKLIIVK